MSVIVRRAFALLLLAGAVGASLALPAIFDGSQLASRGPLPTGTNPATTEVRVSLPAVVKPHRTFNAPSRPAVTRRPVAPHVAPAVRPRAHPAPAPPIAVVTPVSPPATPAPKPTPAPATPAPAPAPTPATPAAAPVVAAVASEPLTPSAPAPTVPALTDPASTQTREKHGNKIQTGGGDQSDKQGNGGHGDGGNGNGHGDNGHGNGNGNGNGNGKGH